MLLASSRADDKSMAVKSDRFIISLGEKLINGQPEEKEAGNYIRCTLLRVANLLLHLRKQEGLPNASLMDFIKPSYYRSIVTAAKALAGCDDMGSVKTLSLALKYGHDLRKCATICISQALERGDSPSDAENLLRLLDMNWSAEMSKNALRTMKVRKVCSVFIGSCCCYSQVTKINQVRLLPLTEDILKLTLGMAQAAEKCCSVLRDGYLSQKRDAWVELCEVTLGVLLSSTENGQARSQK